MNEAFEQAVAEGLSYFAARTHVNPETVAFLGLSWLDGGYRVDADGKPTRDNNGNTVAWSTVEDLDPTNEDHVEQVNEWYGA